MKTTDNVSVYSEGAAPRWTVPVIFLVAWAVVLVASPVRAGTPPPSGPVPLAEARAEAGAYGSAAGTESRADPYAEVTLGVTHRWDNLDWNKAGSGVNILSELIWRDMAAVGFRGVSRSVTPEGIYLKGLFDYAIIYTGENQDSDYASNDRGNEFSRSLNSGDAGNMWDVSAALGYLLRPRSAFRVAPVAGYAFHKQNLHITDGNQVISKGSTTPSLGSFEGLDSTYRAFWHGPWAGADLFYDAEKLKLIGGVEVHYVYEYEAVANWNLRGDFAHPESFRHYSDGVGLVISLSGDYTLSERLSVNAAAGGRLFHARAGTDRIFLADGTVSDNRLNEVNWDSIHASLGVTYRY